jgi:hypothetical protein
MNKPGWKTTEWWSAVAGELIGLAALFGVFTPEQATDLIGASGQIAGAVIMAISTGGYAISRGMSKRTGP